MSSHGPSQEKGVNTSLACQESYACDGSEEALFECTECATLQCSLCELEVHKQERLQDHQRAPIGPGHVPYCDSCKGGNGKGSGNGSGSGKRNLAVIRCQTCKTNLCQDCQKRTHNGGGKKKHPLTHYPPPRSAHSSGAQTGAQNNASSGQAQAKTQQAQQAKLLEKVTSFLLVDESEEMQVNIASCFSYSSAKYSQVCVCMCVCVGVWLCICVWEKDMHWGNWEGNERFPQNNIQTKVFPLLCNLSLD